MRDLGQLILRHATQQFLPRDARLEAGQRGTEAVVQPVAQREVTRRVPVDVEALGFEELTLVEVCRGPEQKHTRSDWDRALVKRDVAHGGPW